MDEIEKLAQYFKALSDPTRLRLIKLLQEQQGALCVNALARKLGVTQSAVSQHLRTLKQIGLVQSERRGNHVHYFLDPKKVDACTTLVLETLDTKT